MNKDREIDELFKSFKPDVNAERIMTEISGKMDVIDMVKPEQDLMNRFHRMVSACCFIVGLLAGCFLMGLVLYHPSADNALLNLVFTGNRFPELTMFYTDHRDTILTLLAATSFILGSLPLINTNEWSRSA
ncbi:MAG: hypothetical protein MJY94_04360 [Bacteroidales bacterium]|nr:hypothetical protein [Bacteroidales bacterium]